MFDSKRYHLTPISASEAGNFSLFYVRLLRHFPALSCYIFNSRDKSKLFIGGSQTAILLLHLCKLRAYNIIIYTTTVNQVCDNLLEQMPNSVCFCWRTVVSFCFCPSGQILSWQECNKSIVFPKQLCRCLLKVWTI